MRVALVIEDDYATRRVIAQALLAEGYGVCECHAPDPIPFTPSLDVIVTDVVTRPEVAAVRAWARSLQDRFGVPLVLVTGRSEIVAAGPAPPRVAAILAETVSLS